MNIVFLGSGAFGIPSLNALAASSHNILHVISQPDRPAGRGKHLTPTPVSQWALDRQLPLTRTANANAPEMLQLLRDLKPDAIVVIAFGQKLSDELLAIPPNTPINLHSSLLPKYRGAAPINWAVINNDAKAGVCVIEVTNVMDAGDILAVASTPIGLEETAGELHDRLAALGAPLLPQVLDQLAAGTVSRTAQDKTLITKAPKLSRETAWVDFTRTSLAASARIRGLSPWPGVKVELCDREGNRKVAATILKCRATANTNSNPPEDCGTILPDRTIACGAGTLEILSIQPENKKPMDLAAFANGHPFTPGNRLRSVVAPPATMSPAP